MNDQVLLGLALAALGVASLATGVPWLATGAFVAAIPFLAVSVLLTPVQSDGGSAADVVD
jgi:hypothetical protein